MNSIFEPIELEWDGVPYRIEGDSRIMRVLAAIEEHITFMELERGRSTNNPQFAKLSMAYAVALQAAGCKVSAGQVYEGMWKDGKTVEMVTEATSGLLAMMMPKSVIEKAQADAEKSEDESGNSSAGSESTETEES